MAGGTMISSGGPAASYSGGMTTYVFWAILVASCGGLIFGYDIGISGGVTSMHPFLIKFFPDVYRKEMGVQDTNQYCTFNSGKLTLFTSSLYIAALVSCLFASWITRKFGRKPSMMLGGFLFLVGAVVNGAAANVAMLYIGRIFLGIGIGMANQSVPLYLSEMAPYKYRGRLNILFQLMITIGILISNLVNYGTSKVTARFGGWRISLAGAAVPALIVLFGALFLPDTPNYLIDREKPQQARANLKRIRGTEDIDVEFADMVHASEQSKLVTSPWITIRERKYRPMLVMAVLIPALQQLTGINVVMFYAPVLFNTLGFGADASLMSAVITGGVNVLATFVSFTLVDRKGRRFLLIEGALQMFIFQTAVGVLIWNKFGTTGIATIPQSYAIVVVICICAFVAGFAWSWGPLGWLVPSEIFPLEIRSAGQSITVGVNMLFTWLIAQIFLWLLCHVKFGLFFIFAGFTLVMAAFAYWLVPETKGVPIEEMWIVWKNHKVWGRFIPDDVVNIQMKDIKK